MCVAQISSAQDELMALIRKAQSRGLNVVNIEFEERALAEEGAFIIDTVQVASKGFGPYPLGHIAARERIAEWLWKQSPAYKAPSFLGRI
jgi:hypothetical protein